MAFAVQIVPSALAELQSIRVFYRRQIAEAIEQQLQHQPLSAARHRRVMRAPEAGFDFQPPLWELRVGDFRVFYDVDEESNIVHVRSVREKPPHATTEDVL